QCDANTPVVGYRMSSRARATDEWEWMVSHTATMLYMPSIHRAGATWSYQRIRAMGLDRVLVPGWPDTETAFNHALRDAGIEPKFIGQDLNEQRLVDGDIDHVRSYAGSSLYHADHHKLASGWMKEALKEAWGRITDWRAINLAEKEATSYQPQ